MGVTSPPEPTDGQNLSLGPLHTTAAIEMKKSWLNQPESGLFSPGGFLFAIPADEAGGFWPVVFPPGESLVLQEDNSSSFYEGIPWLPAFINRAARRQ